MEFYCIYGIATLLSEVGGLAYILTAHSSHSAIQETQTPFYSTPTFSFKGSLRIFLNQPIWHLQSHFNIITALSFFFFFCWDNGTHVSGCWKTIHNYYYFRLVHLIISLLFNYLSTTTFSGKFLTLSVNANFNFQYQQTESALSEILESASVQWDKLIKSYNLLQPLKMNAAPANLISLSAQKKQNFVFPLICVP